MVVGCHSFLTASPILSLTPGSNLSSSAGTTTGWGFSIDNDANYIEITSAQFCVTPIDFPISCTLSSLGTFTDVISTTSLIVGHLGGTLPANVTAPSPGLGNFDFDPAAPLFATEFGSIFLTYNEYDLDPNDPLSTFLGTGILSAEASVTVADQGALVPEPAAFAMIAAALSAMVIRARLALAHTLISSSKNGESRSIASGEWLGT